MSTSSPGNGPLIEQFTYPALEKRLLQASGGSQSEPGPLAGTVTEADATAREASAYRRGLLEGQQMGRTETAGLIEQSKAAIAAALADFARERATYFQDIEAEVIALALSVARKILNRETQVDPLVLKGVVCAALERLSAGTAVRLYVPPSQAESWRRVLSAELAHRTLEVIEDSAAIGQQCRIETELGNTHLSVETQLKEIELGFADLLACAPRPRL